MPIEIYKLPITSSWIDSARFYTRLWRTCELVCEYEEGQNSEARRLCLVFGNCWGVKITYFVAVDADLIPLTYDRVVDFGDTDWLRKINTNIAASQMKVEPLKHLGLYFDDGPLYEFICGSFET
jgi:hypothetical protein